MPPQNPDQYPSVKEQARDYVAAWIRLDRRIKRIMEEAEQVVKQSGGDINAYLATIDGFYDLKEERKDLRVQIMDILEKKPNLADNIAKWGFSYEGFDPADYQEGGTSEPGDGSGLTTGNQNQNQNREDDEDASKKKPKTDGDDKDPPFASNKWLPGKKWRDFKVLIGPNGKQRIVYEYKFGNNIVEVGLWAPNDRAKLERMGIKPGEGKKITLAQAKRIQMVGTAGELIIHGEDRGPLNAVVRDIKRSYKGTEILDNDEVLGIIIAQATLGLSNQAVQGLLRNTGWYKRTTEWQRHWNLDLKDADRQSYIDTYSQMLKNDLKSTYGYDWQQYVDPSKVEEWASKIASGKWGTSGDPASGREFWLSRQINKAEKIEGTTAWMRKQQELIAEGEFYNGPEDLSEKLRGDVIQWLGYSGKDKAKLDNDAIQRWSEDLFFERKSDDQWADYLRSLHQQYYKYLDPDVPFLDFQSGFKSRAEEVLGTALSADDALITDLAARDADGRRISDQAMSFADFDEMVRRDERFRSSRFAGDRVDEFTSLFNSMFNGVPA